MARSGESLFPQELLKLSEALLEQAKAKGFKIATAESCTGGLIAGCLTAIPGSAEVVDRGFVTYSNEAKTELLGVDPALIKEKGAVSSEVAIAMVEGTLKQSRADLAVSVTGIAGPTGGRIGLVYMAVKRGGDDGESIVERHDFGDLGRNNVRLEAVRAAITLLRKLA